MYLVVFHRDRVSDKISFSNLIYTERMYLLVRPDGKTIPIVVLEKDDKSIKVSNEQGDMRWIKFTEFVLKENLILIKE